MLDWSVDNSFADDDDYDDDLDGDDDYDDDLDGDDDYDDDLDGDDFDVFAMETLFTNAVTLEWAMAKPTMVTICFSDVNIFLF